MVELGLGKNMVRSVRFWVGATGVAAAKAEGVGYELTDFGTIIFGHDGLDEFLEDIRTLWLLHWNLSTHADTPLLAWEFLLNYWHEPELVPTTVLKALFQQASRGESSVSPVTVEQHLATFLHTYIPTGGGSAKYKKTISIARWSNWREGARHA